MAKNKARQTRVGFEPHMTMGYQVSKCSSYLGPKVP